MAKTGSTPPWSLNVKTALSAIDIEVQSYLDSRYVGLHGFSGFPVGPRIEATSAAPADGVSIGWLYAAVGSPLGG